MTSATPKPKTYAQNSPPSTTPPYRPTSPPAHPPPACGYELIVTTGAGKLLLCQASVKPALLRETARLPAIRASRNVSTGRPVATSRPGRECENAIEEPVRGRGDVMNDWND